MINNKRIHNIKCEINIIPFLDILLVLLLIFMISTPIIIENFEVHLPSTFSHTAQIKNKHYRPQIILEVLGNNNYNLYIDYKKIERISTNQIISKLTSSQINTILTDALFSIAGDKDIPYNDIVQALSLLNSIGVTKVKILTHSI